MKPLEKYDVAASAKEKRIARERDRQDLADGNKTRDDLRRENGAFAFPSVQLDLDSAKSLS